MIDGLTAMGVIQIENMRLYFIPLFPRTGIHVNMVRHLVNMNGGGDGSIFCLRNSRKALSVVHLIDRKIFKNFNIFTLSKVNRVGLHNLRVKAML